MAKKWGFSSLLAGIDNFKNTSFHYTRIKIQGILCSVLIYLLSLNCVNNVKIHKKM